MMRGMTNALTAQAQMAGNGRASVRLGIVSSYDPSNYSAKVKIQPEDTETGWLPIVSPWVGNGWGIFAPPSVGDLVEVQFQEDGIEAGFICQRFYNDSDRPASVPSGEFWLVHKSGSKLKFLNSGDVELESNANLKATVGGNATITVTGNAFLTAATFVVDAITTFKKAVTIQGLLTYAAGLVGSGGSGASAQITGSVQLTGGDITADGIGLKAHHHTAQGSNSQTTAAQA